MFSFSWSKKPRATKTKAPSARKLRCESLESRCMMTAGMLHTTFGNGGYAHTSWAGGDLKVNAMAQYPDGKYLAAGQFVYKDSSGITHREFGVSRYTVDGALDTSFNGGKLVRLAYNGVNDVIYSTCIDFTNPKNPKILVAGSTQVPLAKNSNASNVQFAVARFNADGTPDTTFGDFATVRKVTSRTGKTMVEMGGGDEAHGVTVANNMIYVGGNRHGATGTTSTSDFALVRLDMSGSIDSTFGTGGTGKVFVDFGGRDVVKAMLSTETQIVLAGYTQPLDAAGVRYGPTSASVAKVNLDGRLDASFDLDGKATYQFGDQQTIPQIDQETLGQSIVASGQDLILAGANGSVNGSVEAGFIARIKRDGSLDNTFGDTVLLADGTTQHTGVVQTQVQVVAVAIDSQQRILALSPLSDASQVGSPYLVRYTAAGVVDATFQASGLSGFNPGIILLQPDGKILLGGNHYDSIYGNYDNLFARVLS